MQTEQTVAEFKDFLSNFQKGNSVTLAFQLCQA